jgi:hypothetical protein
VSAATTTELENALSEYGAGLEAEVALLQHLQRLAREQREAGLCNDVGRLTDCSDHRTRIMAGLLEIEEQIRPMRRLILDNLPAARSLPGFADVSLQHRAASNHVTAILGSDQETLAALHAIDDQRRTAAQLLESGENTLAAYRRVIAPHSSNAGLVNERG